MAGASLLLALGIALGSGALAHAQGTATPKVLVFHKTTGTPHGSTTAGVAAIKEIGAANAFTVEDTSDAAAFTAANLGNYAAVVFLSTNGDVLTAAQETAFQNYVRGGGGFVGIHDAARVEGGSAWFTGLIGARPHAQSPTAVQQAIVEMQDQVHPAGKGLPTEWQRSDEWFNWQPNPAGNVHVVANLRERSYQDKGTGANGWEHPVSWCRDYEGGRSFYTGMGHTTESYAEADFRKHLLGAIRWAAGLTRANCKASIEANYSAERLTAPNALAGTTPESRLDQIGEPHGLSIADDGRVFYIGRADKGNFNRVTNWSQPNAFRGWGTVHVWDPSKPAAARVKLVGTLDVFGDSGGGDELIKKEEGLIGIVLDPNFAQNKYMYLHYSPYSEQDFVKRIGTRRISRFTYDEQAARLDMASEKPIIEWEYQNHSCCHMGGDMDIDKDGNLLILTGDTNSSGRTNGYSGNFVPNVFPGGLPFNDARRTAGNTNDLNGKILRIKPLANPSGEPGIGRTYSIPAGNLFTGNETEGGRTGLTRPEIFVMGVRNPTRMWIDDQTGWIMTGWVGPDASNASAELGPARYENLAVITQAGNYGWPYCTGNNQPYRDRLDSGAVSNGTPGNPTGWYDCARPVNESPYNTGLTNLPTVIPANMWYASAGGGPVHPMDPATGRPDYSKPPVLTQPYLGGGGGQATMPGPLYRYNANSTSTTKFPEFWDQKWFFDDHNRGSTARAVGVDADMVAKHEGPKTAVDITGIIGKAGVQGMGMKFGPDGNLYLLDYGGGFFSITPRSSLWRVQYTGGAATPGATARGTAIGGFRASFSSAGSGGVSYRWDFGDGQSSTQANPTHTYAEAKRYTAKLTVTYADGGTDSTNVVVDVLAQADEQAPVTTHTLTSASAGGPNGYTSPVTIALAATDAGGSGLDRTEYRVNGGAFQPYTMPFTRSQPGDYAVEYRSRDRSGNVEATKTMTFKLMVVQNCPTVLNDEFSGTSLDPKWEILRDDAAARSLADGRLRMLVRAGDMIAGTATAKNVLLQRAPAGSWVASTKLDVSTLTNEGEQAGLVLWSNEGTGANRFAKIVYINKGATQRFEYVATRNNAQDIQIGPTFTGGLTEVHLRVRANGSGTYVAEGSADGETWQQIANPITNIGDPSTLKIGLKISDNANSENAALFDYFRVDCSDRVAPTTTAKVTPDKADGQLGWYSTAPTVELTADDGALGRIGKIEYRIDGGALRTYDGTPFKVEGAGTHVVEYFATDAAEAPNTETPKRLTLRVDAAAPTTGVNLDRSAGDDGPVKVTLDPKDGDGGSGAVLTQYRVDGGPWKTYSYKDEQIFDGTAASLAQWAQAPSGRFDLMADGSGGITPVGGLGMLWYPVKAYGDFRVKLQFREGRTDGGHSNGGVFVRFPDPRTPLAQRTDDCAKTGNAANSQAWVAIFCGHEIQLYDGEAGEPRKTGSVYTFDNNTIDKIGPAKRLGEWNDYEIEVRGQSYKIFRNGQLINEYENTPDKRSDRGGDPDASKRQFARGYIGLQNHGGADTMQYRDIRVEDLSPEAQALKDATGAFTVSGKGPHTIEVRSVDAAGNMEAKRTTEFEIGRTAPAGNTDPNPPGGGNNNPPSGGNNNPGPQPPVIDTPASFKLGTMAARTSARTFARRGIMVPVQCTAAMSGSVKLTVSASTARALGLRSRTLASRSVRCWGPHTMKVTLKASKAMANRILKGRAGRRAPKTVKVTLAVQLSDTGSGKPAQTERKTITIRR